MNPKITGRIKELQFLSSGSKIGVQVMWFIVLVIVPRIFPGAIELDYPISITVNVSLALTTSIIFEILKNIHHRKGKSYQWVINLQLLTSILLLTWFLHVFGRINGPFFVLYLLTIMESALNLSVYFPNIVVAIAATATSTEFFWLIMQKEIVFNLYFCLQLLVRLVSLFFMRSYGISLAQKLIDENKAKNEALVYTKTLRGIKEKLEKANRQLKGIDRQKDEFLSMAAHELRAPLSAIKGYLSMVLEGDTGDIPEKARGFLADANAINERLVRLINNMLNVSKIEGGLMVYQLEAENLSRVTKLVFAQFQPEAERKGLDYKFEIPFEIRDRVKVDPDRIQEVIGNLISNAVKYTDKGSVTIRLSQPVKDKVRFEVEDTGPGISEEEQVKLFKKFSRAESAVGKTVGTGLGLYISKLLVEKFSGDIGVKSEVGKGSTFWFEIPLFNG